MDKIIYKLPKDVPMSDHLQKKAVAYIEVLLYGIRYYIPITKRVIRYFHIKTSKSKLVMDYDQTMQLHDLCQEIINATYLQIRDTIGCEIKRELNDKIEDGFSRLFSDKLDKIVDDSMIKMIPEK